MESLLLARKASGTGYCATCTWPRRSRSAVRRPRWTKRWSARGGSQQCVVIEHVHVYKGGKAIVGQVSSRAGDIPRQGDDGRKPFAARESASPDRPTSGRAGRQRQCAQAWLSVGLGGSASARGNAAHPRGAGADARRVKPSSVYSPTASGIPRPLLGSRLVQPGQTTSRRGSAALQGPVCLASSSGRAPASPGRPQGRQRAAIRC
jgi:hypothetical protein